MDHPLGLVAAETVDERGQAQHRVRAQGGIRRVARLAQCGNAHRERRLLADADADGDPAVGELVAHAGAFVDRVLAGDVGPLAHEPWQPHLLVAVLLVRLADEHDVASRSEVGAGQRGEGDRPRRGLVLHVGGAAAPDEAVLVQMAGERRMLPVLRLGRNDVGVPEKAERRPVAGAGDPRDQIGAVGIPGNDLRVDAHGLEVPGDLERRRRLAPRRVRRVDADQGTKEGGHLLAQSGVVHLADRFAVEGRREPATLELGEEGLNGEHRFGTGDARAERAPLDRASERPPRAGRR